MAAFRLALLVMVIGVASAEEKKAKIDPAKLIGTWKLMKTDTLKALPEGVELKMEFKKDGKMNVISRMNRKVEKISGTYSVKGDQLTMSEAATPGKDATITVLTDKKLVTVHEEGGRKYTSYFEK
jgi:uncharacterized protein (TIGR03066 family)